MSWYKQTSVWAVVISIVALVLSQMSPIGEWFPTSQLDINLGKEIGLPTDLGKPGYFLLVDFDNRGNRPLYVSNLQLEVTYPNGSKGTFDETYYMEPGGDRSFAPTILKLKPEDRWTGYLGFSLRMSPNEEVTIGRLKQKVSTSIFQKSRALNTKDIPEADKNLIDEATQLFHQRMTLETGLYKATLSCDKNGEKVAVKTFEFTLYDYHIDTVKSQASDLRYGWGVNLLTDRNKELWVKISRVE